MNETKICSKCNTELPATTEYFNKHKDGKFGLRPECKECRKEYQKQSYKNLNESQLEKRRQYNSSPHAKELRKIRESKNPEKKKDDYRQWSYKNKDKLKVKNKKYYEEHHEEFNKKSRRWKINNPEKVNIQCLKRESKKRELPSNYTYNDWILTMTLFDNRCAYCGETSDALSQDHFVPLSKGGEYTINNIIPACKSCNCSKQASNFFVWYPQQPFYSEKRKNKILEFLGYDEDEKVQQLAFLI